MFRRCHFYILLSIAITRAWDNHLVDVRGCNCRCFNLNNAEVCDIVKKVETTAINTSYNMERVLRLIHLFENFEDRIRRISRETHKEELNKLNKTLNEIQTNNTKLEDALKKSEERVTNLENILEATIAFQEKLLQNTTDMHIKSEVHINETKKDFEAQLTEMKTETDSLKSNLKKEKKHRKTFELELLQNITEIYSMTEVQFNKSLDLQSQLTDVKIDTDLTKTDIEKEKKSRNIFHQELLQKITAMQFLTEIHFNETNNDFKAQLTEMKNETELLKSEVKKEKKKRKQLQHELLQNITEMNFVNGIEFNKSKTDFQSQLTHMKFDTGLLKSDIEKKKKSIERFQHELLQNITEMNCVTGIEFNKLKIDFQSQLTDMKINSDLQKTDIEKEKKSIERFEENIIHFSKEMSEIQSKNQDLQRNVTDVDRRLEVLKYSEIKAWKILQGFLKKLVAVLHKVFKVLPNIPSFQI